jgi:trigger factor
VNVTVEELAPCRKLVRVEVDIEAVEAAYTKVTAQFQREMRLPGFRPGKAPLDRVIKAYASEIDEEVKRQLISNHYRQAISEKKLDVVNYPDIEEIQFNRGEPLIFAATIEIAPQFELPEYKKLPIKRETGGVTDEDMQRALKLLQERNAHFHDVDRAIQADDFAVLNYQATSDGKPLTEFSPTARGLTEQKDFWMQIQPDSFVPGFTEQLVGAKAGEKRAVNVDFPADFVAPKLSGMKAVYEVEVIKVKERHLPDMDDAFAKSYDAENMEALREGVRRDLQNERNTTQRRSSRNQIISQLIGRVQFDLPESVVQTETRNLVYEIVKENQDRGVSKEVIDKEKDKIFSQATETAKDRVKASYLLNRIAQKEGIRVPEDEVIQRILYMAHREQVKPEKLIKQLKEQGRIADIHQEILANKVLDFLELNAQVEETAPEPKTGA